MYDLHRVVYMHETPPLLVDKSGTMSIEIISGINATFYCSH